MPEQPLAFPPSVSFLTAELPVISPVLGPAPYSALDSTGAKHLQLPGKFKPPKSTRNQLAVQGQPKVNVTNLTYIDWLIIQVYFAFVLGIGFALKRYMRTSSDFFLAGRSIPAWVCGLAFISTNLAAHEVIGMGASGAKYGILTS